MKNTLIVAGLALLGAAVQSYAAVQGTVSAQNWTGSQIMYQSAAGATSVALPLTGYVEILGGPVGGALTSLATVQPQADGYFDAGVLVIPGVAGGATASLQVRAWVGATTYAAAPSQGSVSFTQTAGSWDDAAVPPAPKTGPDVAMGSLTVGPAVIPEPSTIALALLGAGALLIRRRK